jgi:DNA repair photolyase
MTALATVPAPLVQEISACRVLTVNPYRACDIRCAYCITGAQGVSRPRFGVEAVREQLRHELDALGHRQPRVGLGTLCDAYPSVEPELGVTRIVLDELMRLGWRITVVTKGAGVRRDIDLLLLGGADVVISVSTLSHDALARLEPGAPTPAERVDLIRELADAGVPVRVSASPWIPGVGDVASLARSLDTTIPITVAPLNVNSPEVRRTGFGRRFDQYEIDRAYLEERERSTDFTSVRWLPPVTARGWDNQEQVMIPLEALTAARTGSGG